jgi:hypothetical protein
MVAPVIWLGVAALVCVLLWSASQPGPEPWADDTDCRGLYWHTVRAPSAFERVAMWRTRAALVAELGDADAHPVMSGAWRVFVGRCRAGELKRGRP